MTADSRAISTSSAVIDRRYSLWNMACLCPVVGDMRDHLGFTLIETLIATLVLVSGLVAVAAIFLYSVDTGLRNQRRTAATALLYEKMEQFRSAPVDDSIW